MKHEEVTRKFELVVVIALQALIILTITIATVLLFVLFATGLRSRVIQIDSLDGLQLALQRAFGGILMVLLGLELLETLRIYFREHDVRVEVILVVAMIAVGRRIIEVDFSHTQVQQLLGVSVLMLSLAVSYFLVKRAHARSLAPERSDNLTGS